MKSTIRWETRWANIEDAQNISELVNRGYRGDSSKMGWTTEADLLGGQRTDAQTIKSILQSSNQKILLLEMENEITGCVLLEKEDFKTLFGMFVINPTSQGHGLGKLLMNEAENLARTQGSTLMEMTVITSRIELIDFYKRRGYKATGIKKPFPMNDSKFGVPKVSHLEFEVLQKEL